MSAQPNQDSGKKRSAPMAPLIEGLKPKILEAFQGDNVAGLPRPELALRIGEIVTKTLGEKSNKLNLLERRALVGELINWLVTSSPLAPEDEDAIAAEPQSSDSSRREATASANTPVVENAKDRVQPLVMERLDLAAASQLPRQELAEQMAEIVKEVLHEEQIRLNAAEQQQVIELLLDDMLGLGPLEPLLADEKVTDILVNGASQVYVERKGKLEITDVKFRDDKHVMNVARRIVSRIGRRIDETTPLCDARLQDGSRVNIIIPPLAIDGPSLSIRKFAKKGITLDIMARQANISPAMATVLKIASRSQLNILISGGTGSGKTTLLNAMSQMIDPGERVVTIEDAAELQLQQPHVVRLETRPENLEGQGEVNMRDLVKNALRMRPDRIILGEVRGSEAVDMPAGHEYRPRRLARHDPRQPPARSPHPSREHDRHGRHQSAQPRHAYPDRLGPGFGRPGLAHARRRPPRHSHRGSGRHGGRGHHDTNPLHLRFRGRRRRRQHQGPLQACRSQAALYPEGRLFRARSKPFGGHGVSIADAIASGSIGLQELLFLIVPIGLALLLVAFAFSGSSERKLFKRRVARVRGDKMALAELSTPEVSVRRKKASGKLTGIDNVLERALPRRELLVKRLESTGLNISLAAYVIICVVVAALCIGGALASGIVPLPAAILGGVAGGAILPHFLVAALIKRRQARFIANFPEAIDLMTRGLKSGLPIMESMKTAGQEVPDPVGKELRQVVDAVRLGAKMEDALLETSNRLGLQEFKFFTISLAIQAETGGNLTETLMNLSEVLRKRRQLKLKIKALSGEAKASAYIIGSLPFVMAGIIYMINPGYISQLVIDPRGHILIGLGLTSFAVGATVMFKMVRFDY